MDKFRREISTKGEISNFFEFSTIIYTTFVKPTFYLIIIIDYISEQYIISLIEIHIIFMVDIMLKVVIHKIQNVEMWKTSHYIHITRAHT